MCSIVQGADWHWGPSRAPQAATNTTAAVEQPPYIKDSALVTCILAFILFFAYLALQVCWVLLHSVACGWVCMPTCTCTLCSHTHTHTHTQQQGQSCIVHVMTMLVYIQSCTITTVSFCRFSTVSHLTESRK